MTRFEIYHKFFWKRQSWTLGSNYEWNIELDVNNNIKIIRNITKLPVRDYHLSGEFSINHSWILECSTIEKNFNRYLFPHQDVLSIKVKRKFVSHTEIVIQGHVEITEIRDKRDQQVQTEGPKGTQPKSLEKKSKEETHQMHLEKLSSDFERLLDSQTSCFADVTLKCGDISIPAHKIILSVRSPVFSAMFANPMKESHRNEVDIIDIDISTLWALLIYMYTGKIPDFTNLSAADLMVAADKYEIEDLKTACSDFLKDTVSLENVLIILVLGDMIDEDLKSFAVDYICNTVAEFSTLENTEEWRKLRREKPDLSMDVLTSLVKSMNTKS